MILNESQVRQVLNLAGFRGSDLETAVLIAECESGFDTDAHNLTNREDSRGLMQINVMANPVYYTWDLYDPYQNALAAHEIYRAWDGFGAWTCESYANIQRIKPVIIFGGLAFIGYLLLS